MDLSNIIFIYCLLMCVVTREGLGTANRISSLLLSGELLESNSGLWACYPQSHLAPHLPLLLDRVSCVTDWPRTHSVAQGNCKQDPPHFFSLGNTGMNHHTQLMPVILGIKPRVSLVLSKHLPTKPHPWA